MTSTTPLSDRSVQELLRLHASVLDELRGRKVLRSSNNPVADYAEWLVAEALGLVRERGSTTGFDAKSKDGHRYEIKARRDTSSAQASMLSAIRGIEKRHFDFLVVVVFNENYTVKRAVQIPYDAVIGVAKYRSHVNAHIVMLRSIWSVQGAEDITAKLLATIDAGASGAGEREDGAAAASAC